MARVAGLGQEDLTPPVQGTMAEKAVGEHAIKDDSVTGLGALATQADRTITDDSGLDPSANTDLDTAEHPVHQVPDEAEKAEIGEHGDRSDSYAVSSPLQHSNEASAGSAVELYAAASVDIDPTLLSFVDPRDRQEDKASLRVLATQDVIEVAEIERKHYEAGVAEIESDRATFEALLLEAKELLAVEAIEGYFVDDANQDLLEDTEVQHPIAMATDHEHSVRIVQALEKGMGLDENSFTENFTNIIARDIKDTIKSDREAYAAKGKDPDVAMHRTTYQMRLHRNVVKSYIGDLVENSIEQAFQEAKSKIENDTLVQERAESELADRPNFIAKLLGRIGMAVEKNQDDDAQGGVDESDVEYETPVERLQNILDDKNDLNDLDARAMKHARERIIGILSAAKEKVTFVGNTSDENIDRLRLSEGRVEVGKAFVEYFGGKTEDFDPKFDMDKQEVTAFRFNGFTDGKVPELTTLEDGTVVVEMVDDLVERIIKSCRGAISVIPPKPGSDTEMTGLFGIYETGTGDEAVAGGHLIELWFDTKGWKSKGRNRRLVTINAEHVSQKVVSSAKTDWIEMNTMYDLADLSKEVHKRLKPDAAEQDEADISDTYQPSSLNGAPNQIEAASK